MQNAFLLKAFLTLSLLVGIFAADALNAQVVWQQASLQTSTGTGVNATSLSVPRPTGLANGDMVIIHVHMSDRHNTLTAPTGFNLITSSVGANVGDDHATYAYYKIITDLASEPANYPFTRSTLGSGQDRGWVLRAIRITGFNPTNPFPAGVAGGNWGGTTSNTVTRTLTTTNNLVVTAYSSANPTSNIIPPTYSSTSYGNGGGNVSHSSAYETVKDAGSIQRRFNWDQTTNSSMILYAIAPSFSSNLDIDGDGIPNEIDVDSDNDGILDIEECSQPLNTAEFNGTFGTTSTFRDLQSPPGGGYTYASGPGSLDPAAVYSVISYNSSFAAHSTNGIWDGLRGHTTGAVDDAYLAVNGSTTIGTFYSQTITLQPNTNYEISLWAINARLFPPDPLAGDPNVQVRMMNGATQIAAVSTGILPALNRLGGEAYPTDWRQAVLQFNSGANTSLTLQVRNLGIAGGGNDFAIDQI